MPAGRPLFHLSTLVLIAGLLGACGNKGPLVKPAPPTTTSPTPTATQPASGTVGH